MAAVDILILCLGLSLFPGCILILAVIVHRAPRGCEDETGYHNCDDCPQAGCK